MVPDEVMMSVHLVHWDCSALLPARQSLGTGPRVEVDGKMEGFLALSSPPGLTLALWAELPGLIPALGAQ